MTIYYTPESMWLTTNVLDFREYLPPSRVYAPVNRNISITTEAQSNLKHEPQDPSPWYIGADGNVIEEDLLSFLKSTVRIKKEAQILTTNLANSPERKGTFDSIDSAESPFSSSALNEFHKRITSAKVTELKTPVPRPRMYSAAPRSNITQHSISSSCVLSAAPLTKLQPTTLVPPIEDDISISALIVPHSSSNYDESAIQKDVHTMSKQKVEAVCNALNLTASSIPWRSNVNIIKSKSVASELLTTVLKESLTFSSDVRRRRSPKSAINKQ